MMKQNKSFTEHLQEEFDIISEQKKVLIKLQVRTGIQIIKEGDMISRTGLQTAVIKLLMDILDAHEGLGCGEGKGE